MRKIVAPLPVLLFCFLMVEDSRAQTYPMHITPVEKLYGLSVLWHEAGTHFVPNGMHSGIDADSLYQAFIPTVIKTANDYEYYRLLQRFLCTFKDANTFVGMPGSLADSILSPPVVIDEIRGRYYVTNVDVRLQEKLPVGSEVLRVNGHEINAWLETEALPYAAGCTEQHRLSLALESMLSGWANTQVLLNFITPDGKTVNELFVRTGTSKARWVYDNVMESRDKTLRLEWPARDIALIRIGRIDAETLAAFPVSKQLSRAGGIILDLRYCSHSGNIADAAQLAARFVSLPYLVLPGFGWRNYPVNFSAMRYGKMGKNPYYTRQAPDTFFIPMETDTIRQPLVVLTGPGTGNTAEHFVSFLGQEPDRATLVGKPTAGSTGSSVAADLPGGGKCYINARFDFYPGLEGAAVEGIQPGIMVLPDLKSLLNGEDVAFRKALETIRE